MDHAGKLFRCLERHLISDRHSKGFNDDVDNFISFSLSVHNRRKSRVGLALENHLEIMFKELGVRYSRNARTERKSRPDFLFPGKSEYRDIEFSELRLTMLGVKSTCKDRWRQVLSEAARIRDKHLLTQEAAISNAQTDEMQANRLQLVLPRALHHTYTSVQQGWLMDVAEFIDMVLKRQG